jgi:hypothetical protein
MFQLTAEEFTALNSQFAISNPGRGGRRTNPFSVDIRPIVSYNAQKK